MARQKKDATKSSLVVSVVFHGAVILGILYFAAKTGMIPDKLSKFIGIIPEKKQPEKKPEPPPETPTKEEVKEAIPAETPPPVVASQPPPLTARAADPNARAIGGQSSFGADVRAPDAKPAPALQRRTVAGTGQQAATVAPVTAAPSLFSAEATRPSTVASVLQERRAAQSIQDIISSEQISKSGSSDAGDVVTKLPGITVTDGKNAVVRGLNERYLGVRLNGADVPSADPYRTSVQLDLFPAAMIDRVVVSKSFTPDLPGNSTGGGVNIITRSFPAKFIFSAGLGIEANIRTTGNDKFLSYQGGGTDWLGLDDGTRALPGELAAPGLVLPPRVSSSGVPTSPNYAGNLAQADRLDGLTKTLGPTEFAPTSRSALPNGSGSLSFGDTTLLADRRLGYFGSLSYKRTFLYTDGETRRLGPGNAPGSYDLRKEFHDERGLEEVNWAAVANLAYELSPEHQVGFNFLHNQSAEDVARRQTGTISDAQGLEFHLNRLHWTERFLTTFQLRGEHLFPELGDLKANWLTAYSQTGQEEPDARFFNFATAGSDAYPEGAFLPTPSKPTRYFRNLEEDNLNLKLDLRLPFHLGSGREGEVKVGGFSSESQRDFRDREIFYEGLYDSTDAFPFAGDPNQFFPPGSLGYTTRTNSRGNILYTWNRYVQSRDSTYEGQNTIRAGYLMTELPLTSSVKVTGGVRYETTDLNIGSVSSLPNAITGSVTNNSTLSQIDVLPAVNLAWALTTNLTLRTSFGQTVARPSFREFAAYRSYDPVLDELLEGNPTLRMSAIMNYDLRLEWFPRPGSVFAVSLFYKDLKDAIEKQFLTTDGEIITYLNRPTANVLGVELEARQGLGGLSPALADFSVGMNLALIQSEAKMTPSEVFNRTQFLGDSSDTRPLYDQSPYILNLDVGYDNDRTGTSVTVGFNIFGPRITIAGLSTPDVYEQPVAALDVVVSQKLGRNWKLRFSAKNLLDPRIERTYGEASSGPLYSGYRRGMAFGLSANYEF